jgi:hypothetical protein
MNIRRVLRGGLVVPVVAALALSPAEAQVTTSWTNPGTGSFEVPWFGSKPVAFEGYYTHYRLDADGEDRFGMNGVGARLMWRPAPGDSLSSMPRLGLGLFGEYAPASDLGFSLVHLGVQGDLTLVPEPWFGRLMPVVSLGAGLLRSNVDDGSEGTPSQFPVGSRSTSAFAVTPAAGMAFEFWRDIGLRADVRYLVTFRDATRHNWQFTAGLSFPF